MKTYAMLLILLAFSSSFISTLQMAFRESLSNDSSLSPLTSSNPMANVHSTHLVSNSIIKVYKSESQTTSVILDTNETMKIINIGLSTLVNPLDEIKRKIDSNLLNLTKLVIHDYLENNETNVIISLSADTSSNQAAELLRQKTLTNIVHLVHQDPAVPSDLQFLGMKLKYSAIFSLVSDYRIRHVWLDRKIKACLDQSVDIIKDPIDWADLESSHNRKVNGTGIRIAILDTGIDSTHPDFFFPNGTTKIVSSISFTNESIEDKNGHGTHVASIAAGTGAASGGQYTGVAPSSALLNVKVLDANGEGTEMDIIDGIFWAVENRANILSMSFGGGITSNGSDPLSLVVDWATQQGVVAVVAAGNLGSELYTITDPGVASLAITVGASTKQDTIASFSSRGPTVDYRIKPDIIAPGVNIVAARAANTTLGTPISTNYTQASGTSMATPHAAGAAALLLDLHPGWGPEIIKAALANFAEDIGSSVLDQGSGRIEISKSAEASILGNSSTSFGRVHMNNTYEQLIMVENLRNISLYLTLDVETWEIESGVIHNVVSANASFLNIPPEESKAILLLLNTSVGLPNGYFEGRVTATIEGGSIKMAYFFCILSELNCEVLSEESSLIQAAFVVIDREDGELVDFSPEIESARFSVPPGEYIIQALNVYGLSYSGSEMNETYSFLVHKKVSLGTDENLNVQLSLASAQKLSIKTKDDNGQALHLKLKELFTPFYRITFLSEIGTLPSQNLYLSNISEYMTTPCYFGFMGFSQDDINWDETMTLLSDIDVYFIGWDISTFGILPVPESLNYTSLELATFDIKNSFPTPSDELSIWFNHLAGLWQSGLWYGYQTYPGIIWKAHVLPYQFKQSQSADWAQLEWSCIYSRGPYPDSTDDYFVIDRHFLPIENGERLSYSIGKTPLLPSLVQNSSSYYGDGLRIPYYPLQSEETLYLGKHDRLASKQVEVKKDGTIIYNETTLWAEDPIHITGFLETHGLGLYSFTIKAETSMDICTKNIVRYDINHTSSNDDLLPPSIIRIEAPSSFTNEYPVEIQVSDNEQLEDVILTYSLDGAPWLVAPINDYGGGIYSANINLAPTIQEVSLAVEARDSNNNTVWFSTDPAARKGYSTQINGTLDGDKIIGKLIINGGTLSQPVYLKVKTNDTIMYILTDVQGNFQFTIPQTLIFPVELEMMNLGPYEGSILLIDWLANDWPYDVTGDDYCGIDDIVAVAVHFGLQPTDPDWNPIYDINNDEYVDIDDIVIISEHFGTTNPS